MNILSKLFSKKQTPPSVPEEQLVPVPIPALGVLLLNVEQKKGSPLTEAEVLEIRNNCVCMMLPVSNLEELAKIRSYYDIDPRP